MPSRSLEYVVEMVKLTFQCDKDSVKCSHSIVGLLEGLPLEISPKLNSVVQLGVKAYTQGKCNVFRHC